MPSQHRSLVYLGLVFYYPYYLDLSSDLEKKINKIYSLPNERNTLDLSNMGLRANATPMGLQNNKPTR